MISYAPALWTPHEPSIFAFTPLRLANWWALGRGHIKLTDAALLGTAAAGVIRCALAILRASRAGQEQHGWEPGEERS